jgi:predicted PurR-regulated permease PerM
MALPVRQQAIYWGAAAIVFLLALRGLGDVILPFVVGGALAYFLDPVADALERLGLNRTAATVVISLLALVVVVLAALVVIPLMVDQIVAMANATPAAVKALYELLSERFPTLADPSSTLRKSLAAVGEVIASKGGTLVQQVLAGAISVISAAVFIVVVPVVTFYLLLDWDNMVARIDALLPRDHAPVVRRLAADVDRVLAGFVRGQLTVCLILGVFYSAALMTVGLQFGLVVGAIAGLLTFIPYVGSLVGGALSIGLALAQFWGDPLWIGVVAAIFLAGQFVEGNFLTPKLVGGSVGLHPVWLLFALSAFGTLFGFVGMLIAVPVAAAFGVLTRFGVEQYLDSRLYHGLSRRDGDGEA